MLTLLLISMLMLAFNIQTVKASLTVHNIDTGEDFATIQEAIDDAETLNEHTILVDAGTYYEHVTISKSISLIGENRSTTIIDGGGTGTLVYVTANNTIISGFTIQNSGDYFPCSGIHLYRSSNSNITNNILSKNLCGILLQFSANNSLVNNNVTNNANGILLEYRSSNNTLVGNTVSNNGFGISFSSCSNNSLAGNSVSDNEDYGIQIVASSNFVLSDNHMVTNKYDFMVGGSAAEDFDHSIDTSNLVDGKPIYYVKGVSDMVYDSSTHAGIFYAINCHNITIKDLAFTNNGYGTFLWNTNNSKIQNNIATNNREDGICLHRSSNNTLIENAVSNNGEHGISLHDSSNNSLVGNTASNNKFGILLIKSSNNSLVGNNITNIQHGIFLGLSSNNNISGNNITNNMYGITLGSSSENLICHNNITANKLCGIWLERSSGNSIYNNNFINKNQVYDTSWDYPYIPNSINTWDDGYPSGGNYWSDYAIRYPGAQELDGSGIWDTPYFIDENNQDNYPLMEPWSPKPPSPQEALEELTQTVESWNLGTGIETSLTSKLQAAYHSLDRENQKASLGQLTAFMNEVEALRDKKLSDEQADYLTSEAQRIINLIEG